MPKLNDLLIRVKKQTRWQLLLGTTALVVALAFLLRGNDGTRGDAAVFVARRGPLNITVLEGGSIQALESQEIKCEIRSAPTKILRIVEEGYLVTPDDIATNKVLVELDASELQKQIVQQDISYESARASLIDAQENYAIQLGQSLSDIKAAEQKARFARMDFDKFLSTNVTEKLIEQLGIEKELAATQTDINQLTSAVLASASDETSSAATNAPSAPAESPALPSVLTNMMTSPLAEPLVPVPSVDFSKYAQFETLGDSEAKQKLRKLADDLQVAQKELTQAQNNLNGTKRLYAKGYVTKTDLERDELAYENSRLKVQTAETARDLFLKYDFAKSAEEYLSKYIEATREVVRARRAGVAKVAQAQAKLKSAQGLFNIQSRTRKDLYEQLAKCNITAQKPGLVVYGGGRDLRFGEERVMEGATVRDRQTIITIPDMTKMSVQVKIHESYIKKIKKGQAAHITVDAYPDQVLDGEVTKVGVLPDSQNRWLNPDMKVYLTTITINGTHDWLKPGMSAKCEILVARLDDVVHVPIQSVTTWNGQQVCYVLNGGKPERRLVEIGENNDEFVEIRNGLREGERVLLRPLASPVPQQATEPTPGKNTEPKPAKEN